MALGQALDKINYYFHLGVLNKCLSSYFQVGEYRINFDYTPSERYIIDMKNVHIGLVSKINPVVVKKAEVLCTVSTTVTKASQDV